MGLEDLVWDSFNSTHIVKHNVTQAEVAEAYQNRLEVSETKKGRLLLVGKTNSGRWISVVLANKGNGTYYPVTARDSDKKERRQANEQKNKKQNSWIQKSSRRGRFLGHT